MATLRISLGVVNITDHLRVVLREVSAPLSIVASQLFPPPHDDQRNIIFTDLNAVNHYVEWWRSDAGGALTERLLRSEVDLAIVTGVSFGWLEIVVGRGWDSPNFDPAIGDSVYNNPDLQGTSFLVSKTGYGFLSYTNEISPVGTGGFQFIDGQTFGEGERFTLLVSKTATAPAAPSGSKDISDVVLLTADNVLNASHYNKLIVFSPPANTIIATLPPLGTIPNLTVFQFDASQGNQVYGTIAFQSGEGAAFLVHTNGGALRNKIHLAKGENIKLIIKDGVAYVLAYTGNYSIVGQPVFTYLQDGNILPADGLVLYQGNVYKRIYEEILKLPAQAVVSIEDDWNEISNQNGVPVRINRGKFFRDVANGTFRTPDLRGRYLWFRTSGITGTYYPWEVGPHDHPLPIEDFGNTDRQSLVRTSLNDEGINEANRTGLNNAGGQNHVERIGFSPFVWI